MPPTPPEHDAAVLRGIVDASNDALVVIDQRGVVALANVRAGTLLAATSEELVGSLVEELVPGATWAASDGTTTTGLAVRRDGTRFPVEVSATPLPDELTCLSLCDVSEREAVVAASLRMRDELIASVSHELRTPLTSILGYTEILVDMGEPAISGHAARLLEIVRRNAERELKLVEDLLTVSELGGAGLTLDPVPTDLAAVVDAAIDELGAMATESGITLTRSGEPSLWVVGDACRLTDVVTNVVMNAVKFSRSCGGQVEVGLVVDGEYGVVEVHDGGVGIDAHELPQLFDPLYRTAGAVAAAVPGAGLGLPIVKGIVEAHAGEIDVASEPGNGTTVKVRLPLAAEPAAATA
ncbi:PAS domain-containing sensor histidine kinase [Nocardioides sp.]|uniref:PAS domain-containing sensor histidine kinase n=1 Tax=Nocardioides sp. TaxID=35761 RepID=UPI002ED18FBC